MRTNSERSPEEILLRLRAQAQLELLKRTKGEVEQRTTTERLENWREDFEGAFCPLLDIIPREGPRQKLRLNAIQSAFSFARTGRDYVLKARQVGFTTEELARDLWFFLTRKGARVVIIVQSSSDDAALKEVAEKVRLMIDALRNEGIALPFDIETATHWVLRSNDSSLKIIGAGASETAAAKKGRGGTIHRLHITELAFFEFARTTLNAVLECVPAREYGTEIVIESTPNGASGAFYENFKAAEAGTSGYKAHFYAWHDEPLYRTALAAGESVTPDPSNPREAVLCANARVSPEQLKWYRAKVLEKGQNIIDQEYPSDSETCWLVSGRTFFDKQVTAKQLAACTSPSVKELGDDLWIWSPPIRGRSYILAADPSEGTGGDPGAAGVFERETGEHVATLYGQFPPWVFGEKLAHVGHMYFGALIAVERNNHGHAVLQALRHGFNYENIYRAKDKKLGWNNVELTRASALDALENAQRTGAWASRDARVVAEQRTFIVSKSGKPEAAPGSHDDLIMMSAIAWDILRKPIVQRNEVHDYDDQPEDEWT